MYVPVFLIFYYFFFGSRGYTVELNRQAEIYLDVTFKLSIQLNSVEMAIICDNNIEYA